MSEFVPEDARCLGKRVYASRNDVMYEIARILKESLGGVGAYLRPYRCRFCGLWHLTDTSKK